MTGREVYLKLECFQPIKVFKLRGAYNKIVQVREASVVAASSGNHGIAVAYSSHILGKRCTVVIPESAVREKAEAIMSYGAEIVTAGRFSQEREAKARELSTKMGAAFIHPYNDPEVIAGQGTCGLEISEQLDEFDSVLVPVGGGGLISGISIALKSKGKGPKVFGVEPKGAPKLTAALGAGKPVTIPSPSSIADGLIPSSLGDLTYEACSRYVDGAITATEDEIFNATKFMIENAGILCEPSGATPLVPLLSGSTLPLGNRVVVVVSGGNISGPLLRKVFLS